MPISPVFVLNNRVVNRFLACFAFGLVEHHPLIVERYPDAKARAERYGIRCWRENSVMVFVFTISPVGEMNL